jgi:hypothetical protein
MVSTEVLAILLSGVGISGSLLYYASVLRNTSRAQQIQMLQRLHDSKSDKEGLEHFFELMWLEWSDFDDYMSKYSPRNNPKTSSIMESQLSYLDGLGVLVKNNVVDLETVYDITGRRIIMIWFQFESVIDGLRKGPDFGPGPDYCESFEYLAEEMIKIRNRRGQPLPIYYLHPTTTRYKHLIQ